MYEYMYEYIYIEIVPNIMNLRVLRYYMPYMIAQKSLSTAPRRYLHHQCIYIYDNLHIYYYWPIIYINIEYIYIHLYINGVITGGWWRVRMLYLFRSTLYTWSQTHTFTRITFNVAFSSQITFSKTHTKSGALHLHFIVFNSEYKSSQIFKLSIQAAYRYVRVVSFDMGAHLLGLFYRHRAIYLPTTT